MRSIWLIFPCLLFSFLLGGGASLHAGWLGRQMERAKNWTQFYKQSKGDYAQETYVETPDWEDGLSRRWIGVGEDHTVFLAHGELFHAGGAQNGKALKSFEKVKNAPKVKDLIASGAMSYALDDAGELYRWQGISDSGELGALARVASGGEGASDAQWISAGSGVMRVDGNLVTLYSGTPGGEAKQMVLPKRISGVSSNKGQPAFLMDGGYAMGGGMRRGARLDSFWEDAVSLESTDDALWVLTQAGSVWRVDGSGSFPVQLDAPLKEITAGSGHVLGLDESGHVWSWGKNTHGQLGSGNLEYAEVPVQVEGLEDIIAIAAGYDQSFAISSREGLLAWGNNASGQLGLPNAGKMQLLPKAAHMVGAQYLSKTTSDKAPVRIYFPQTGATVGASYSL